MVRTLTGLAVLCLVVVVILALLKVMITIALRRGQDINQWDDIASDLALPSVVEQRRSRGASLPS